MRITMTLPVLAVALVASPLAHAQRASLADRVAVLEQRAAGEQNGTELVNQISQLRSEVQELRGRSSSCNSSKSRPNKASARNIWT